MPSDPGMNAHLRVARPVTDLERSVNMYRHGLRLNEIGRFEDHDGFDGVMLGSRGQRYHFEFTHYRVGPVKPTPTPEDLLVFYIPNRSKWRRTCTAMIDAGFREVLSFNPYWKQKGRTFEDPDGYRVVIQQDRWANEAG